MRVYTRIPEYICSHQSASDYHKLSFVPAMTTRLLSQNVKGTSARNISFWWLKNSVSNRIFFQLNPTIDLQWVGL